MSAEILTVAECYAADRHAVDNGISTLSLMENAGRAIADAIIARYAPCRTVVICGPGNNGGDGFAAARHLSNQGWSVSVLLMAKRGDLRGDADEMAKRWHGPILPPEADFVADAELIVDALFGAGLSRPLEGVARRLAEQANSGTVPVVSIDVPSGLGGDTGRPPEGGICVDAELTVTFFRPKPAHILMPGRLYCGELVVADIGIPESAIDAIGPRIFENRPLLWLDCFPWPDPLGHKYSRGHAVAVSGPVHATGAARLAARAALRIGAGLVSVASPPEAVSVNAASLTAIMVKPFSGAAGLSELLGDTRLNAVVIGPGCGVGRATIDMVSAVLAGPAACVLDADALTSFSEDAKRLYRLVRDPCVLTPHAREFSRIFPGVLEQSQSRIEAVRAAAAEVKATVLLKGPDTVVADASGLVAVNANAPSWLATAGAGDVLSGMIAGLMAQGMDPFNAACAAAWLHGEAAALVGPGLISEDLSELLPAVLGTLSETGAGAGGGT